MQYNEDYFKSEDFKELLESYESARQIGEQPFLDADDRFESGMLQEAYELCEETEADICCYAADSFDANSGVKEEYKAAFDRRYIPETNPFDPASDETRETVLQMFNGVPWSKLFRRTFVQEAELRFQNTRTTNDAYFVYTALCKAGRIATLDRTLVHRRKNREGSLTKEATSQDRMQIIKAFVDALLSSDHRDDIYLDQTIKRGLSSRYMSISIYPDRNAAKEYTRLLKDLQKRFRKADFYSFREKVRYSVFILFPVVYWAFRSIKEPYMWKWERIERRKRREAKRTIPSSH